MIPRHLLTVLRTTLDARTRPSAMPTIACGPTPPPQLDRMTATHLLKEDAVRCRRGEEQAERPGRAEDAARRFDSHVAQLRREVDEARGRR